MTRTGFYHVALAVSAGFSRFLAAVHAWRIERQNRRALEGLSDEQLKDIGFRRIPSDPPYFERW